MRRSAARVFAAVYLPERVTSSNPMIVAARTAPAEVDAPDASGEPYGPPRLDADARWSRPPRRSRRHAAWNAVPSAAAHAALVAVLLAAPLPQPVAPSIEEIPVEVIVA